MIPIHVAPTTTAVRDAMRPGIEKCYRNLLDIFSHLPADYMDNTSRLHHLQQTVDNLPFERFCQSNAVFAEPHECIDRLQAMRDEFGLCQMICWFDQGRMLSLDEVKRTTARFGDVIMPRL